MRFYTQLLVPTLPVYEVVIDSQPKVLLYLIIYSLCAWLWDWMYVGCGCLRSIYLTCFYIFFHCSALFSCFIVVYVLLLFFKFNVIFLFLYIFFSFRLLYKQYNVSNVVKYNVPSLYIFPSNYLISIQYRREYRCWSPVLKIVRYRRYLVVD